VAEALRRQIDAAASLLEAGQAEREPEPAERAALRALGAPSLAAWAAYDRVLSAQLGAQYNDDAFTERLAEALAREHPRWARAQALLALARFEEPSRVEDLARKALAAAEPGRDPGGELILRTFLAPAGGRMSILAAAAQAHRDDVLYLWMLGSNASGDGNEPAALQAWRQALELRPDLQNGEDATNLLFISGRGAEARELVQAWAARAPESEQAFLTLAALAASEGRAAEAEGALKKVLLFHGESPHRLIPVCLVYLQIGRRDEAARLAAALSRGNPVQRNYGHFFTGITEVLAGRLNGAEQSFRAAYDLGKGQGVIGNGNQALEELRSLASVVGDATELRRLDLERAAHFARLGLLDFESFARFEAALDERTEHGCPDLARYLDAAQGVGRTALRLLLVRASAAAGCTPCTEAIRLGVSPSESIQRSLYQLATCAESEGKLALASDLFGRMSWSGVRPTVFGSTALSVLARFRRARTLRDQGRAAEARAALEEFLRYWGATDRPVAEVDQARAALAAWR
jgi:tetratricopeptide (TPR) repeat protein